MASRTSSCRILALCFVLLGCSDVPDPLPGRARNVILISLDTVRADHLGVYGYERNTSPSLDGLAAEGALFENSVAVSPWTRPSHTTLLTGVYPLSHGARTFRTRLSPHVVSIAELFQEAGFRTAGVVSSQLLDESSGLARGFASYRYISERGRRDAGRMSTNPGKLITDEAVRWLEDRDDRRFFLFLHYYDAHSDYAAQPEYRRMFESEHLISEIDGSTSQLMQVLRGKRALSKPDLNRLISLYDAEIRQLDDEIGRLLRFLEANDLRSSTLIVVTSDHGEEFMEHDGVLHARTYYSEVIDVPLFMAGPGVPSAFEEENPVSLVDVAPTLLSLMGLSVPGGMVGVDLSRSFRDDSWSWPERYLFAEADHSNEEPDQFRMVLGTRYKLILNRKDGTTELYDLLKDPDERTDVSDQHVELVRSYLKALEAFESEPAPAAETLDLSQERIEALRELGYTE